MRLYKICFLLLVLVVTSCNQKEKSLHPDEIIIINKSILEEFDNRLMMLNAFRDAHQQLIDSIDFIANSDVSTMDSLGNKLNDFTIFTKNLLIQFDRSAQEYPREKRLASYNEFIDKYTAQLDSIIKAANQVSIQATMIKEKNDQM